MTLTTFEKKIEDFGVDIVKEFINCGGRLSERQIEEAEGLIQTLNEMINMAKSNRKYDSWVELLQEETES